VAVFSANTTWSGRDKPAIKWSAHSLKRPDADAAAALLGRFDGQALRLPARRRFLPDPEFLSWHRAKWLGSAG